MSWYGKIIGGSLGAIFGPAGAVAGASFGHYYDNKTGKTVKQEKKEPTPMAPEERRRILFESTFFMFAKVAKADGFVSEEEVKTIKTFMLEHLNLNAESRKKATRLFNEAKNNDLPFEPVCLEFTKAYQHDPTTLAQTFEMLLAVALSDGLLHPAEDALLLTCLKNFELNAQAYESIRRDCLPEVDPLYKILSCSPDCSNDELKKAYRQLSKDYHPDRLAAQNVSEGVRQLTEQKFKQISEAYSTLCKFRNIR
ncbi:MAG: TerB family tellurite resistance protein [Lentisphaeraceae bacterium]|nr:TerB family tellurite resistance protein [Lentisphaeraceae bacterium]